MLIQHKPLKRFGQNYLIDKNILNKIIETINPRKDDIIIEIGPGTGTLTKLLAARSNNLIAVEIDKRVVKDLQSELPDVEFISGDFLDVDIKNISEENNKRLRIAGNIPYNITSSIIFKLIDNNEVVNDAVLMVQFEVAKRMTARPGSKDYGILTLLLNYFTKTELCFRVSPNVFFPRPKVYSSLVKLNFKQISESKEFQKLFIKTVKAAFSKRRKTLKNSLGSSHFSNINFDKCGIDLQRRAESLSVDEFLDLTSFIYSQPAN